MRRLTLFLCLLMPSLASAQPTTWADNRVVFLAGATGSFVDIGDGNVRIISCAHQNVHASVRVGNVVECRRYDGASGTARVVAMAPFKLDGSAISDCAVYEFSAGLDRGIKPFRIGQQAAAQGDRVWVVGFPMGRFWSRSTTVVSGNGTLYLAGNGTPGESGSPIVNTKGELIGILSGGEGDGETMETSRNFYTRCSNRDVAISVCNGLLAQCGPNGCGPCANGWCPQPAYRIQPSAPAIQPINPPITPPKPTQPIASVGPQGPAGPPGPPGPPGSNANCECGPKWADINARIDAIRVDVDASQTAITNLTTKVEGLSNRPAPPTAAEVAAEVEKNRKPARIRIVDPQGKYTTAYAEVRDGQDIDLIIEQRFTPAQQAP